MQIGTRVSIGFTMIEGERVEEHGTVLSVEVIAGETLPVKVEMDNGQIWVRPRYFVEVDA